MAEVKIEKSEPALFEEGISENVTKLEVTPDIYEDVEDVIDPKIVKMEIDQDDSVVVKFEPTYDVGQNFSAAGIAKQHFKQVHEKLKPYKCNECEKYFSQLGNLKSHSMLIHKKKHQKVEAYCNICCKPYTNLKNHIDRIHKGIRKYESEELFNVKCKSCDSVFTGHILKLCQHNLKIHIKNVHEGEKKFKCDLCEKYFWHPWHVRRHIDSTHKKIKPVSCDVCGKPFNSKRYLIKYHKCKGAKNVIKPKKELEIDDKTDSEIKYDTRPADDIDVKVDKILKPFNCSTCGETFSTAGSVKLHFKLVHEN